jgi:hypothetical protein
MVRPVCSRVWIEEGLTTVMIMVTVKQDCEDNDVLELKSQQSYRVKGYTNDLDNTRTI